MVRRLLVLLVATLAGLCAFGPALAAAPVFPPGSRIGLEPPAGLTLSSRFPGFEDSARKVTITVVELPGAAYEAIEQSAFGNTAKGLTIDSRRIFNFEGGLGYLLSGHAQIDGENLHAWYLLANVANPEVGRIGAFVRVHVPEAAREAYPEDVILAALRSVTFRALPIAEVLARLPYKLQELAGFRIMDIAPSGIVVLIDGPTNDPLNHPSMVTSLGTGAPQDASDRARFASDLLRSAPLKDIVVTSVEPMRIGNSPGYEVRANAKGPGGAPLALVQWLRFRGTSFIRVIGTVAKDRWDEVFPRFRAVRDGIELR